MAYANNTQNKHTWCKGGLGNYLKKNNYNITNIYPCRFGHLCRNAHNPLELKKKKEILDWEKRDKSDINLLEIYDELKKTIKANYFLVKNKKYKSMIEHYEQMDFVSLFNLWFEVTCYHRKIKKELKYDQTKIIDEYSYGNIPEFKIKNEDYMWSFQRTLRVCKQHKNFINYNGTALSIRDICIGTFNCKNGIHHEDDLACLDDMIHGKCDCISLQVYNETKKFLENELRNERCSKKIEKYKLALLKLKRKVHYTEQGMICLDKRIELNEQKEKEHFDINRVKSVKKLRKKNFNS